MLTANSLELGEGSLTQIMNLLEYQLGIHSEIVLHDLSKDYDKTIVDIRNGHITSRRIGDCGSNLGLEVISGTSKEGDTFNYITHTRDGKILRSSSIYLKNASGKVRYAICINTDITDTVRFESFLKGYNRYDVTGNHEVVDEIFVNNVQDLLEELVTRGETMIGKKAAEMNKAEKIRLLDFLDSKGAFLIAKSSERICKVLDVSKFTFYNYLEIAKNGEDKSDQEK